MDLRTRRAGAPRRSLRRSGASPGPVARGGRRLAQPDMLAILALVAVPVLLYVPVAVAGHATLPGDDLTQNYPLRVLSGELLRAGHLPGWDPYLWSGTPLLAGWNAGALFPGTWLFAFLPGLAAWTVNLVAVGVVAGTGCYLLVRRLRCGPVASLLAALAFTYTGFMSGQVVHIGLVQGTSFLPYLLLSLDVLAAPGRRVLPLPARPARAARDEAPSWRPTRRDLRWCAVFALASALTVLAGDPRAVSTSAIAVALYLSARCLSLGRRAGPFLARALAASLVGVALAAAQWLPGLTFLHASQRGVSAFTFFEGGSLALTEIGALLALPFALGGNGNFGLATYAGDYNLPEVTIGVGIVALVAAFALLPAALAPVRDRLSRRSLRRVPGTAGGRELGVWYVTGAIGTVLSLGSYTPLAHALVHVPLFGGERLQNRNAALLDLALVVLLAFFVDDLVGRRRGAGEAAARNAPGPLGTRPRRALALLPVAGTAVMVALSYVAPAALEDAIGVTVPEPGVFAAVRPYLLASALVAAGVGALVLAWRLLGPRARSGLLVAFVLADVTTYVANASYASAPAGSLASDGSSTAALRAVTGRQGRFAIFNPSYGGTGDQVYSLGVTDLNVLRHLASVQGYGSIVEGAYQDATATHAFEALDASRLAGPTFDSLDLRALVTLPSYLGQPLRRGSPIPLPGGRAVRPDGRAVASREAPARVQLASGPWTVRPSATASFLLPSPAVLDGVTVVVESAAAGLRTVEVGLGGATGPVRWRAAPIRRDVATLRVPPRPATEQVALRASAPLRVAAVVAARPGRLGSLLLDGELQGLVSPPHWRWARRIGGLTVFANARARGAAWLEPAGARSPDGPVARDGTASTTTARATGAQVVRVATTRPATLVRSTTFARGWTARLTPVGGGRSIVETVTRLGLVEQVPVPAGRYVVTWRYAPESMTTGLALSGAAFLLVVALLSATVTGRPSRRRPVRN